MLESFHFVNTSSPATARVMPFRLPLLTSVILWAGLCSQASALTLGPVRALAYLGQPLDATIVVQLGPGETLSDRCVGATVTAGETVVPADQITTTFVAPPGFEARIRVRTWVPVDEPVVMVQVTAGCDRLVTRQFTVFVDPPPTAVALEPSTAAPSPAAPPLPAMPAVEGRAEPPGRRVAAGGVSPPSRPASRRAAGSGQRPAAAASAAPAVAPVGRPRRAPAGTESDPRPRRPAPRPDRHHRAGYRRSCGD